VSEPWTASLRPGDEVLVTRGYYGEDVGTVVRLTPSGIVVVSAGGRESKFNPDGRERGFSGSFVTTRIRPLTPEDRGRIEAKNLADGLGATRWHELPLPALRTAWGVVQAAREVAKKEES
jgi:hypothetical protein